MAGASNAARLWRTAFLTMRDEVLASPPPAALSDLLNAVVFPQSPIALAAAAVELPVHEVVSDVVFLAELCSRVAEGDGVAETLLLVCRLVHSVSCKIRLELSSSSWITMLGFFENILEYFLGNANKNIEFSSNPVGVQCMIEIVEILRCIPLGHGLNRSSSDCAKTIDFLLRVVLSSYNGLFCQSFQNSLDNCKSGRRDTRCSSLWELHTIAFSMIVDALSRYGSSISIAMWQFSLEVLRKIMDTIASKKSLLQGYQMTRFYVALLDYLHLVLSNPKVSSSEHVTGLVVGLKGFLTYGLNCNSPLLIGDRSSDQSKSGSTEAGDNRGARYVPPHLRKTGGLSSRPSNAGASDFAISKYELASSDSDLSDSDRAARDGDRFRSSKARISALICIQDLCRSDPKSHTSIWGMLLPTTDVLQPRKCQETLMSCLLFDPVLKTRVAAASTLSTILEFNSSVLKQVAEYKESSKCGSFTTLSSSLGQILLQIHRGILHLIQQETTGGLLASIFKILVLLISATPYSRMPGAMLPTIINTISERIRMGPTPKGDQTTLLGTAFNCLAAAMSTPPSEHVALMLEEQLSEGVSFADARQSAISIMFQFSQMEMHPTVRFEALQALRALLHNYPNVASVCWEDISSCVHLLLKSFPKDASIKPGNASELAHERTIVAAIKVLDEGLRAVSGFQGTNDLSECRLLDIQLLSDNRRAKRVSSAPSYESYDFPLGNHPLGSNHWDEVIDKHLLVILSHSSSMIRAAGITCFAGMTSSVFFSLKNDKQSFILSSLIFSALDDEVASVRSAACRGIGVISSFPQVFNSSKVLSDIVHAVESNTRDPQISVRIASSWALANICDSLRHRATDMHSEASPEYVGQLFESALRLSKDSDKIKSNAVRALGNLSIFFTSINFLGNTTSHWLERMIETFVSCVTTGNVKVQWNVCHALGNLFLNKSLKLQDVPWAPSVYSILMLLLRGSTNYKIRIHAAVALTVPESREDYGKSFSDILQSVGHALESLVSGQVQDSSSFKYRDALEKQLTLTTLHLLGLGSVNEDQALKDFLTKKASFFEQWLSSFSKSLPLALDNDPGDQESGSESSAARRQMVSRAAKYLQELYENISQSRISKRLENLALSFS